MQCFPGLVLALSSLLGALALLQLSLHLRVPSRYGKHEERLVRPRGRLPARCAWFLQELPSFLVPALLLALRSPPRLEPLGCRLLCCLFCWHYFYRYRRRARPCRRAPPSKPRELRERAQPEPGGRRGRGTSRLQHRSLPRPARHPRAPPDRPGRHLCPGPAAAEGAGGARVLEAGKRMDAWNCYLSGKGRKHKRKGRGKKRKKKKKFL